MKKYVYVFIMVIGLIFSVKVQGQKTLQKSFEILLRPTPEHDLSGLGFFCSKVIDKRTLKRNIGTVKKGIFEMQKQAIFPLDFSDYVKNVINLMLNPSEEKDSFILIFHEFRISEQIIKYKNSSVFSLNSVSEVGVFQIKVEFAKEVDGKLVSVEIIDKEIMNDGIDVTLMHSDRILKGLKYCMFQFNMKDRNLIKKNNDVLGNSIFFTNGVLPQKGLYKNFANFSNNRSKADKFRISKYGSEKFPRYQIFNDYEMEVNNRIFYVSDGIEMYIECSRYRIKSDYFVKAKHIGKYIYFEDEYPNSQASLFFGSLIPHTAHAFILDTTSGSILPLDNLLVSELLVRTKQTKIMMDFNNTKGEYDDREAAIIALNNALSE